MLQPPLVPRSGGSPSFAGDARCSSRSIAEVELMADVLMQYELNLDIERQNP
jgi:hypothetical protein